MAGKKCPLCGKTYNDLLGHLVTTHKIEGIDHLKEEMSEGDKRKERIKEFGKIVEELNKKLRNGEITGREFRELTAKWQREH